MDKSFVVTVQEEGNPTIKYVKGEMMKRLLQGLKYRINNIGKLPICNCKRDRAPIIMGYSFLLCWRCTSILISLLGMRILFENNLEMNQLIQDNVLMVIILAVILVFPTTFDGIRQYVFHKESTNKRRIITGFIAGYGLFLIKMLF